MLAPVLERPLEVRDWTPLADGVFGPLPELLVPPGVAVAPAAAYAAAATPAAVEGRNATARRRHAVPHKPAPHKPAETSAATPAATDGPRVLWQAPPRLAVCLVGVPRTLIVRTDQALNLRANVR